MALIADRDAFENAVMQLWHVASWCKNETGELVPAPSRDVQRYRSAIRVALSGLFNAPIKTSAEVENHNE